jgi:hypothetical protein
MLAPFQLYRLIIRGARLNVHDRVDPYVAVYEPPEPTTIGEITHLCWRGLLSPAFVQKIVDTIVYAIMGLLYFLTLMPFLERTSNRTQAISQQLPVVHSLVHP